MNRSELFKSMRAIVDAHVVAYKSDLEYDVEWINRVDRAAYVWLVRDYGTNMSRFDRGIDTMSYIESVEDCMRVLARFVITVSGEDCAIQEVTEREVSAVVAARDSYKVEVTYENGDTDSYTVIAGSPEEAAAMVEGYDLRALSDVRAYAA